jgi:hypothetical protein
MRKLVLLALGVSLLTATSSEAASFSLGSVDLTLRSVEPGLTLWWEPTPSDDWNFTLDSTGQQHVAALFKIGTNEGTLAFDNVIPYGVEVVLAFASPAISASVDGLSGAGWFLASFGYVAFDNPVDLAFGSNGLLQVTLTHALFGLPGKDTVYGTFKLVQPDSGTPSASVPEPATLALLGVALAAAAVRARSRKPLA